MAPPPVTEMASQRKRLTQTLVIADRGGKAHMARTGKPKADEAAPYCKEFKLSITKALGDQLAKALEELEPERAPLTEANIAQVRPESGVYQLYHHDEFVYVGKASTRLPGRLRNHLKKLAGRRKVNLQDISFSCLYVAEDFNALAPEQLLIDRYKQEGKIEWNRNGFGNRDPGRRRDHTAVKVKHFDNRFPINLDIELDGLITPGETTLTALTHETKSKLPYTFRYNTLGKHGEGVITVPDTDLTADQVFHLIATSLPEPWQVVALPGYVVMYPDSPAEYASASRYYRGVERFDATPVVDESENLDNLGDQEEEDEEDEEDSSG